MTRLIIALLLLSSFAPAQQPATQSPGAQEKPQRKRPLVFDNDNICSHSGADADARLEERPEATTRKPDSKMTEPVEGTYNDPEGRFAINVTPGWVKVSNLPLSSAMGNVDSAVAFVSPSIPQAALIIIVSPEQKNTVQIGDQERDFMKNSIFTRLPEARIISEEEVSINGKQVYRLTFESLPPGLTVSDNEDNPLKARYVALSIAGGKRLYGLLAVTAKRDFEKHAQSFESMFSSFNIYK